MITVAFITSRQDPGFEWFFQSLSRQLFPDEAIKIIIVDFFAQVCDGWTENHVRGRHQSVSYIANESGLLKQTKWIAPMPSVWQGPSRLTKENWWAMSAARDSALCHCETEWFLHLDDRCILQPGFMDAAREATQKQQVMLGAYQKRTGVTVHHGIIQNAGIVTGEDSRVDYVKKFRADSAPTPAPGEWYFGCVGLLPTEWALSVNGWDQTCDGMGLEDSIFGLMLQNNGHPIWFDRRMAVVQDRSPDKFGPVMIRKDKGVSPNDRSHALLNMLKDRKKSGHKINLRKTRDMILSGGEWPVANWPTIDFWDSQPLSEM